jgi:hypothetical protein
MNGIYADKEEYCRLLSELDSKCITMYLVRFIIEGLSEEIVDKNLQDKLYYMIHEYFKI